LPDLQIEAHQLAGAFHQFCQSGAAVADAGAAVGPGAEGFAHQDAAVAVLPDVSGVEQDVAALGHVAHFPGQAELGAVDPGAQVAPGGDAGFAAPVVAPGPLQGEGEGHILGQQHAEGAVGAGDDALEGQEHGGGDSRSGTMAGPEYA